jgi:hypothetical protein
MKHIFNHGRGGLVALVAVFASLALALTGCSLAPQELPKLDSSKAVEALNCDEVKSAIDRLDAVEQSTATKDEKEAFEAETKVDPTDKKAMKTLRTRLEQRVYIACEADNAVLVPANDADIESTEFNALTNRCGARLDMSSTIAPAKDDKASFLLKGKGDAVKSFRDYECTLMTSPTVTDAWGQALSKVKAPSGRLISEVNADWLPAAVEKSKDSLASAWTGRSESDGKLYVTEDFQKYAFNIVTLLRRLEKHHGSGTAVWSYALESFDTGLPRAYRTTKAYVGKFIILTYTPKGYACPSITLGINVKDGRPAGLKSRCVAPTSNGGGGGGDKHRRPGKVLVCINNGGDTKWVPKSEAHKYPKRPNKDGTCSKKGQGGNPGLNEGTNESNTVNNNDGATDSKGLQTDPKADAEKAKQEAEAAEKAKQEAAQKAAEEADTSSGGGSEDHGSAGDPGW